MSLHPESGARRLRLGPGALLRSGAQRAHGPSAAGRAQTAAIRPPSLFLRAVRALVMAHPGALQEHADQPRSAAASGMLASRPSAKYAPVELPAKLAALTAAHGPASAPRPPLAWQDTCSRARTRRSLTQLLQQGRPGKHAELAGRDGGRYVGETLAGKPHGRGALYSRPVSGVGPARLLYDGEWCHVRTRQGKGSASFLEHACSTMARRVTRADARPNLCSLSCGHRTGRQHSFARRARSMAGARSTT